MAEDRSQWQMLLEKVEKDLAEHEKKGLALKATRNYLRTLLELPTEEKVGVPTISKIEAHTGTLPKFRKGDFYGLAQAEAGYKVLQRAEGSLTTDEILSVLMDSGYKIGGQDPKRTLYSSLVRSRKLVLVAENTFDLAERRPKVKKLREGEGRGESKERTQSEPQAASKEEGKELSKRKTQFERKTQIAPKGGEETEGS